MRVLLQNRASFLQSLAGDTIQVVKTKEYLVRRGVQAEIDTASDVDLAQYQLVHLFNLIPVAETYQYFQNAKAQQKKIVLSPIYWNPQEFLELEEQAEYFRSWYQSTMPLREEILRGVELILPNSWLELAELEKDFKKLPPAVIVPTAAERFFASASPERFVAKYHCRDFILSVGRICRRKNQLQLIRAVRETPYQLVLIGPVNDLDYYQECRRLARAGQVLFLETMTPLELASAYAAAKVHALVSWYDTPGLVSLEAALAGCRIVTTEKGSPREYFDELVDYCEPGDVESILKALQRAWERPVNPELREKILTYYTWERTALETHWGYQSLLKGD